MPVPRNFCDLQNILTLLRYNDIVTDVNRIEVACLISTLPDDSGSEERRRKESMPKGTASENGTLGAD